jgi:hypothetical protein
MVTNSIKDSGRTRGQRMFGPGCAALVFLLCVRGLCAEIELRGEQDGDYDKSEYRVTADVVIKAGRTLTFAPGAIIRFQRYTGLIAQGALICRGTPAEPIIFTSTNDRSPTDSSTARPLPFDWNGIQIDSTSNMAQFDNVQVAFSSFGIRALSPATTLKIAGTTFRENGSAQLAVGDSVMIVDENKPFSFVKYFPATATVPSTPKFDSIPLPVPVSAPVQVPQRPAWKKPLRIVSSLAAVAGAALWIGGEVMARDYHRDYDVPNTVEAKLWREKRDQMVTFRTIGTVTAIVGAAGFGITIVF